MHGNLKFIIQTFVNIGDYDSYICVIKPYTWYSTQHIFAHHKKQSSTGTVNVL